MEEINLQNNTNQICPTNSEYKEEVSVELGGDEFRSSDSTQEKSSEAQVDHLTTIEVATRESVHPSTMFTKVEKSLASLGFFTPSSRRIKNQKMKHIGFSREIEGKRVEVTADIVPSAIFGLPITADQDKYFALQKIISNKMQSEGTIANPIRFKSAELLRLMNDSTKSGKNYKDVSEWLDVMSSTTIISDGAVYVSGKKRFARDRLDLSPKLRQPVKTHFSLNGELSHGDFTTEVHERV